MELMHRRLRFSAERSFSLYHLCYYLSKSSYRNREQRLILDFKRYEEPAVKHFMVEAITALEHMEIACDSRIVRALNSKEMVYGDFGETAIDRLGQGLANLFGCDYAPESIYKVREIPAVKKMGIADRRAALKGAYRIH
jgi:hypothetical protein